MKLLDEILNEISISVAEIVIKKDTTKFRIKRYTTYTIATEIGETLLGFVIKKKSSLFDKVLAEKIRKYQFKMLARISDFGEYRDEIEDAGDPSSFCFYFLDILHNMETIRIGNNFIRVNPLYEIEAYNSYPKFCAGNSSQAEIVYRAWIKTAKTVSKFYQHAKVPEDDSDPEWQIGLGDEFFTYTDVTDELSECGKEEKINDTYTKSMDKNYNISLFKKILNFNFDCCLTMTPNTHIARKKATIVFLQTPKLLLEILESESNFPINTITTNLMEAINVLTDAKIGKNKKITADTLDLHMNSDLIKQKLSAILGVDSSTLKFICED